MPLSRKARTVLALLALGTGCRDSATDGDTTGNVTFTADVAPIVFQRCSECHRPGGSSPFRLLSYDDAKKRAQQIARVTRDRRMPPWLPEPGDHRFRGEDIRLTDRQIDTIRLWVKHGAAEGDPADLPALPEWKAGWQRGEPDLILQASRSFILPADGFEYVRNFVIPHAAEGPRFVRAAEWLPGTDGRIVRHSVLRIDRTPSSRQRAAEDPEPGFAGVDMAGSVAPDGQILSWTPSTPPRPDSDDTIWRLDPGSDLVLQLRMRPTGKPEEIRPSIGLFFTDEPAEPRPSVLTLDQREIDIPAGVSDYVVGDEIILPVAVDLLGLYPHAHYLCKTMELTAVLPDATEQMLLRIEDWDFRWQKEYRYAKPVGLPAGTTLSMRYTYDNSKANERNPNRPPVRVVYGNTTTDERATLMLQVRARNATERRLLPQGS